MTDLQRALRRALLILALARASLVAQSATVRAGENLRTEPNGDVIGRLDQGLALTRVGARGEWLEVDVEGWMWLRSLQTTKVGGHDLIVSEPAGENLRAGPSGAILGTFPQGALFDERERIPGWARVGRRGWIWAASVDTTRRAARAGTSPKSVNPSRPSSAPPTDVAARRPTTQSDASAPRPTPPSTAGAAGAGGARPSPSTAGAAILAGPGGDTLARVRPGAQMQVLARQGSWVRVRVEGWAWSPVADSAADLKPVDATPAQLAAEPDQFRGRLISWDLQFLSLEKAERIRTEFFEGEPFLLTRHPSGGFVYVAVSPDRLAAASNLLPLERIHVVGRVRAPASALTGSPILDLMELTRTRDRR